MDNEKEIQAVNRCAFGSTAASLSVREHSFTSERTLRCLFSFFRFFLSVFSLQRVTVRILLTGLF